MGQSFRVPKILTEKKRQYNTGSGLQNFENLNFICHPKLGYENYISVDNNLPHEDWSVKHDGIEPIPILEHSFTRI